MSSKISSVLLSVDGGSSTLKYGIITPSGVILDSEKLNIPFNLNSFKNASFKDPLQKILTKSLKNHFVFYIVLGISGLDTKNDVFLVTQKLQKFFKKYFPFLVKKFYVCADVELLLHLSSQENCVALVSGTGSNCIGKNSKNLFSKAGGLGCILTDQGSGYYIGQKALRRVIKTLDGRGDNTAQHLSNYILSYLGLKNAYEIKDYINNSKNFKKTVAHVSFPVIKLFKEKKDLVATSILNEASYELFLHVKAVANNLNFSKEDIFEVVIGGSILNVKYIRQSLSQLLLKNYPNSILTLPKHPPFYGGFFYLKSKDLIYQ